MFEVLPAEEFVDIIPVETWVIDFVVLGAFVVCDVTGLDDFVDDLLDVGFIVDFGDIFVVSVFVDFIVDLVCGVVDRSVGFVMVGGLVGVVFDGFVAIAVLGDAILDAEGTVDVVVTVETVEAFVHCATPPITK